MTRERSFFIFLTLVLLLIQGIPAETLISLDNRFTERWNNGLVPLPDPGTITIPKGPGILTITISEEPYWRAGLSGGTDRIQYQNLGDRNESPVPGLLLGSTYFQNGITYNSREAVTDGLPLITTMRYYSFRNTGTTLSVQILPTITINTNHQLANRVQFKADWEPFKEGRATESGCDVYGTWDTTRGEMNISYPSGVSDYDQRNGNFRKNMEEKGTIEGILTGPVLTGQWTEQKEGEQEKSGRFTVFFRDDCCSFSGTYGTGESDTNSGEWSGLRK